MNTKILDETNLRPIIVGNLRSAINSQGPITKQLLDYAAKLIYNGMAGYLTESIKQEIVERLGKQVEAEFFAQLEEKDKIIEDLQNQRDNLLEKLGLKK